MALQRNEDVAWYVATRKGSGNHLVVNENYIEDYENEFERIREYDTLADAQEALAIRQEADLENKPKSEKQKIKVSKIRGDIRKGNIDEDRLRAQIRKEMELEQLQLTIGAEKEVEAPAPAKKAPVKRTTKPTKEILS